MKRNLSGPDQRKSHAAKLRHLQIFPDIYQISFTEAEWHIHASVN